MQISLISFCKAKALAIHRLIGAQQSDSTSFFFAQTISGGEVPRRGTTGSSPWYAFVSFLRVKKGNARRGTACPKRVSRAPKG